MDRNLASLSAVLTELVALRKESVDRNQELIRVVKPSHRSLSARRAWIEIAQDRRVSGRALVALRKESVDRNCDLELIRNPEAGRSPQGERG